MSTVIGDLDRSIYAAWNASTLNGSFQQYWLSSLRTEFPVLFDFEAPPSQPFPFCVIEKGAGNTVAKMVRSASSRFEIRRVPVTFNIHARSFKGTPKTAKLVATELAEEVMKIFGGHSQSSSIDLSLVHGVVLQTTYLSDNGARTGDDEYQWILRYEFTLDVPVAS